MRAERSPEAGARIHVTADPPTVTASWGRRHVGALVAAAARAHGQRPLVTYSDGATGERTELGCATFENWVAKTANLLVEELGLGPGDVLASALGTHWTTMVISAAAWRVGAAVALPGAGAGAAAVAVREGLPAPEVAGPRLLVGAGLAGRLAGDPGDAVPFAEEVLSFPDDFDDGNHDPEAPVLLVPAPDGPVARSSAELLAAAAAAVEAAGVAPGDRYASTLPLDTPEGVVAGPVAALALGGGLLLVHATPPDRLPALLAAERCTAVLGPGPSAPA